MPEQVQLLATFLHFLQNSFWNDAEEPSVRGFDRPAAAVLHVGHKQHVWTVLVEFEVVSHVLAEHGGREGPEALAILDLEIQRLLHFGIAGIAEDGACAKRARPELHAALEPADGVSRHQRLARALHEVSLVALTVKAPPAFSRRSISGLGVLGAQIGSLHRVERAVRRAGTPKVPVIGGERSTEGAAGVARGRLHPNALEGAVAQDLAVADAVQRHAAGQAQVLDAVGLCEVCASCAA